MAKRKYDWGKLKTEFITGDYLSAREFLAAKGMPVINYPQIVGWGAEKKKYEKDALMASAQQLLKQDVTSLNTVRMRQARLARFLQLKGTTVLKGTEAETVEDARKLVVSGLQEERRALGLEGGVTKQSWMQININPKTNLDKMIEKMSYEQILELIAELKRLGARSVVAKATDSSSGEAEEGETL